ncbi:unnamed protein product, partial [Tetraodon nigroviridis]
CSRTRGGVKEEAEGSGGKKERKQSRSGVRRQIDRGGYSPSWLWLQAVLQVTNPSLTSAVHLLLCRWQAPRERQREQ